MSELAQTTGLIEGKTTIRGKDYIIKPLRLREMADVEKYRKTAETVFEMRAYEVFKHLRDNDGINVDFCLDLTNKEFKAVLEDINNQLYPDIAVDHVAILADLRAWLDEQEPKFHEVIIYLDRVLPKNETEG